MQRAEPVIELRPERGSAAPSLAFVSIACATAASVAGVALVSSDAGVLRALALGIAAALIWIVLDGIAPFGRRQARNAVSAQALGAVAIVLCVSWNLTGFGLRPVAAVTAGALAAVISTLALAAARRLGFRSPPERILVVGSGIVADALVAALAREGRSHVVGQIDDSEDPRLLGDLDSFEQIVERERATVVMFAYSYARDGRLAQLAERSRELDLVVGIVPRLFEQFDQRLRTRQVSGVPLLIVDPLPHQAHMPVLTRCFDVVAATVLLVVTAPIWLVISLAILIEEPGPIFYRATRVGLGGRTFTMFKFRKMRRDAAGPRLTLPGDERFTRIGSLLARTKLDELPQLLNVLRGEMGLVGPRPEDPSYVDLFRAEFDEILSVRPGITGLSQIQYRDEWPCSSATTSTSSTATSCSRARSASTATYAKRRCLALDVRILVWTVVAVIAGARVNHNELTRAVHFEKSDDQEKSDWAPA